MASVENSLNLAISFDKKQPTEQSDGVESEFSSLFSNTLDSKAVKPHAKRAEFVITDAIQNKGKSQVVTQEAVSNLTAGTKVDDDSMGLDEKGSAEKTAQIPLETSDNLEVTTLFAQLQNAATAIINVKVFKANFGMDPDQGGGVEKNVEVETSSTQPEALIPIKSSFTLTPLSQFTASQTPFVLPQESASSSSLLANWFGQVTSEKDAETSELPLPLELDAMGETSDDKTLKSEKLIPLIKVQTASDTEEVDTLKPAVAVLSAIDQKLTSVDLIKNPTAIASVNVDLKEKNNQMRTVVQSIPKQVASPLDIQQRILQLMEQISSDNMTASPAINAGMESVLNAVVAPVNNAGIKESLFESNIATKQFATLDAVGVSVSDSAKLQRVLSEVLPQVAAVLKSSDQGFLPLTAQGTGETAIAKLGLSTAQLTSMSELVTQLSQQVDKLAPELGLDKKVLHELFSKIANLVAPVEDSPINAISDDEMLDTALITKEAIVRDPKSLSNPIAATLIKSIEQPLQQVERARSLAAPLSALMLEPSTQGLVTTPLPEVTETQATSLSAYSSSLPKGEPLKDEISNAAQGNQKLAKNLDEQLGSDLPKSGKADISNPDKLQLAAEKLVHSMIERIAPQVYYAAQVSEVNSERESISNINSIGNLNQLVTQRTQVNTPTPSEAVPSQVLNMFRSEAAKELHDRVSVMLSLNKHEADIRLDPPELGSMQIRVRSDAEQAQINFVVQNQQAKEALEQSLPRLKEMLAEQGIQLGESNIEQQNHQGGGQGHKQQGEGHSEQEVGDEIAQTSLTPARIASNRPGGVDFYA